MSEIIKRRRTVYYSPSAARHYLTKRGAAYREAAEILNAKYPPENEQRDGFGRVECPGFHWSQDERLIKVHRRLTRLLMQKVKDEARGEG